MILLPSILKDKPGYYVLKKTKCQLKFKKNANKNKKNSTVHAIKTLAKGENEPVK